MTNNESNQLDDLRRENETLRQANDNLFKIKQAAVVENQRLKREMKAQYNKGLETAIALVEEALPMGEDRSVIICGLKESMQ